MHDVAVVGGGPGGLYAAQLLAAEGFDVALFEEHATSGDPVHCTGVIACEAFDEFNLPRESVLNPLQTVRFFAPSGDTIQYTTAHVEALAIDRLVFDRRLGESAVRAGARISTGQRVTAISVEPRGVRLTLGATGSCLARACVLACGANYALQRRIGLGMPAVFGQSAQLELPVADRGNVEVHFGRTVAPNGFAWVVPIERPAGAFARVGLMCDGDAAHPFRRFLARIGERWSIQVAPDEVPRPRRKMLPLAPIPRTYTDRLLAIGDAGGIVKATTGGGIYYSLVSAAAAVDVLAPALRRDALDARVLRAYETSWRARLGEEIDAQLQLRQVARLLSDGHVDALFELARTDGIMPIVRRTARFNQHRALILALFRHPPARRVLFDHLRGGAPRLAHAAD
ncbi:MAG TPA: NAD(P)/FAD-dependent oxidoreductase [Vicinamibacterales bacterium]|jgi:geranylgeranyl reductase family protein|nr:NAD(P)/FAD-dependent oxidoreductase [Vicinamibacterales bacterium]